MMIAVLGQFEIHPEDAAKAADLMRTVAAETVKESGCRHYSFAIDVADAARFQLSEWWETAEALSAHFATPHFAAFRAGLSQVRVRSRMVKRFEIAGVQDL